MPVCPKCHAEYQEGYTVCADCKVELVENIKNAEELVPFFQAEDKRIAEKLLKFFQYSDLSAALDYDEENEIYILSVPPRLQAEARKLYQAFYFVERERIEKGESDLFDGPASDHEDDDGDSGESEEADAAMDSEYAEEIPDAEAASDSGSFETEDSSSGQEDAYRAETPADEVSAFDDDDVKAGGDYIMKADQYKDLTGTVWIFLFFGIAGLVVVLLNVLGVLSFFSGWIPNTVMALLFLFFIYIALSTNQKAKKVQAEIDAENKLTGEINEWLKTNVTEDFLASISNENVSSELNYLRQTDTIKELLIKEFGSQNLAYLDRLIEEYYNRTFDNFTE
jgi:transcription initiation factor TFIIIB Brf1 subunit/transcription initiation factor TFIIB